MRHFLSLFAVAAFLLLNGCMEDLSCYRDMIIGTWVEQTFNGQESETNLRAVHIIDRNEQRSIKRMEVQSDGNRIINDLVFYYTITCKTLSSEGYFLEEGETKHIYQEEEVMRFTDTTLRVKVIREMVNGNVVTPTVNEITYKKVSAANTHAKTIQNLWEMAQSSDPTVPPFQMAFDANGSYTFLLKSEEDMWEEKIDEAGKYYMYDSFLMLSFFDNPIFGASEKNDVACWDVLFTDEGEVMRWSAIVHKNGVRTEKHFLFTVVKETTSEE